MPPRTPSDDRRRRDLLRRTKLFKTWVPAASQGGLDIPDTVATLDDGGIDDSTDQVAWGDHVTGKIWTAPTAPDSPTTAKALNGHKILTFAGSKLQGNGAIIGNLPAFAATVLVKAEPADGGNEYGMYAEWFSGVGNQTIEVYHISTTDNAHIAAEFDISDDASHNVFLQSDSVANDTVNGQWNLIEVVQESKSSRWTYIDGAHGRQNTTVLGALTLDVSMIGDGFTGDMAFLHLKASAYTADDRAAIKSHLNTYYGLAFA